VSELPILQTIVNRLEICRTCEHQNAGICARDPAPCLQLAQRDECPAGKFRQRIRIAVIVTNHNYGRFLIGCLRSIRQQARQPDQVFLVNDRCSLEEQADARKIAGMVGGVECRFCDFGDVQLARSLGLRECGADAVLFVDADNELDPLFLKRAERALVNAGPQVAGVYPKIERRSADLQTVEHVISRPWNRDAFFRANYIDACSLVWRHALEASWTNRGVGHECLEDVQMWGQLIRDGWEFVHEPESVLKYRVHSESMSQTEHSKRWSTQFRPTITLFLPLSGRSSARMVYRRAKAAVERAGLDTRLVICNTSNDPKFDDMIRRSAPQLLGVFSDVRIYSQDLQLRHGLADLPRLEHEREVQWAISRIYNRAAQDVKTDLLWIVEDDVIVPVDALERMLALWDPSTVAVSGAYGSRFGRNGQPVIGRPEVVVAWKGGSGNRLNLVTPQELDQFPESMPIAGAGFGCLLIDPAAMRAAGPLAVTDSSPWPDPRMFEQVSKLGQVKLATAVLCRHLNGDRPPVELQRRDRPVFAG
jgi:glycosyltransferase involved in cell wall biosynthesis